MPAHNHSAWTDSAGNHNHSIQCNGWSVGELPSHNHSGSTNWAGEHTHNYNIPLSGSLMELCGGSDSNRTHERFSTVATSNSGNHSHTVIINNTGSNQPHNNLQPYVTCYIWKRVF